MMQPTNLLLVVALGLIVLILMTVSPDNQRVDDVNQTNAMLPRIDTLTQPAAEHPDKAHVEATTPSQKTFSVTIRRPSPPVVELAVGDPQGRVGQVACSTCHSIRKPNLNNRDSSTLDEFHQGMKVAHGKLACYACHNPDDADSLRSAEGVKIAYPDVMTLCSQCHGPQATSFAHGAHGGMNGFWDLSRGPQTKNNCIDCHDPHAPKYPKMIVGFKPRDRFLEGEAPHDHHE